MKAVHQLPSRLKRREPSGWPSFPNALREACRRFSGTAIIGGSNRALGETAMLHGLAVETSAMSIKTLPDNFTTTHDDAAVAVFQSGPGGLVKAKR